MTIAGMSHRTSILNALRNKLSSELDGTKPEYYYTNMYDNVSTRVFKFDEINEFPFIGLALGPETFEYLPSAQQNVTLEILVYAYIRENVDIQEELENIISDIKTVVDTGGNLSYTVSTPDRSSITCHTIDIQLASVDTDEGLLAPFGLAQVSVTVTYSPPRLALRR
ncbi:hypothetical protein P13BB106kb_p117 [Pectobacterium phage DU_PP_V]|uniref:Uncharacterized protein n=1 Tax=Pectobacterium phage DU_PP_V TaxID=2041492 RepID=A0A2D2W724_9CAUD|nr:tail terminator [Pectobacterium phage DU_PP_V]ATS94101.1 hypothetical protein P13BB106kb_p117 [Pectobacterium phage DU_PP_V]